MIDYINFGKLLKVCQSVWCNYLESLPKCVVHINFDKLLKFVKVCGAKFAKVCGVKFAKVCGRGGDAIIHQINYDLKS